MRQAWALACLRRRWKDTESRSYPRTNNGSTRMMGLSRPGLESRWPSSALSREQGEDKGYRVPNCLGAAQRRDRLLRTWSRALLARLPRSVSLLSQPSRGLLEPVHSTCRVFDQFLSGIGHRSKSSLDQCTKADRSLPCSGDIRRVQVSPSDLPCGSGLFQPGAARKELPGAAAESGHGSVRSWPRWGVQGFASPARPFRERCAIDGR